MKVRIILLLCLFIQLSVYGQITPPAPPTPPSPPAAPSAEKASGNGAEKELDLMINKIKQIINEQNVALNKQIAQIEKLLEDKNINATEAQEKIIKTRKAVSDSINVYLEPLEREIEVLIEQRAEKLAEKLAKEVEVIVYKSIENPSKADELKEILKPSDDMKIMTKTIIIRGDSTTVIEKEGSSEEQFEDIKINVNIEKNNDEKKDSLSRKKDFRGEKRLTSQFIFASGLNTLLDDEGLEYLEESPFQLRNSRFYEIGITNKIRLLKKSSFLQLKFGLSFNIHNVRPERNLYFSTENIGQNQNPVLARDLRDYEKDAYFRTSQLVVPLYLEFDFSPSRKNADGVKVIKSQRSFRLGVGGYTGFQFDSRQIINYNVEKTDFREIQSDGFHTDRIVYGLGSYVGFKDVSIYAKYDINNLFKHKNFDEDDNLHNFSLGLRFDLH